MKSSLSIANFDGLPGPTHHYGGLASGNVASASHRGAVANPRAALHQVLDKVQAVREMDVAQGLLPPHPRPHLSTLHAWGFRGTLSSVLEAARRADPCLLSLVSSSSHMWAANAATVTPARDVTEDVNPDGTRAPARTQLTPANLSANPHRHLEAPWTARVLARYFGSPTFQTHDPLSLLADEGAANHTRLQSSKDPVHLFVYGRSLCTPTNSSHTTRFVPRHTREASEAVARRHGLEARRCLFVAQHPGAVDAGVFHNDVIAVGHRHLFLVHEMAFEDTPSVVEQLERRLGQGTRARMVAESELPLREAVSTYLFNAQLVDDPQGGVAMFTPGEVQDNGRSRALCERLVNEGLVSRTIPVDLKQSMQNGGGPACLRLRVPLTEAERLAVHPGAWATPERIQAIRAVGDSLYPDRVTLDDLVDPHLAERSLEAITQIHRILNLGDLDLR